MEGNVRSVMVILPELRAGQVVSELSTALHEAVAAVREHQKAATVTLTLKVAPVSGERLVELPVTISGDIDVKLPKKGPEATVFFVDDNGNPSRNAQARQPDLSFGVVQPTAQQGG